MIILGIVVVFFIIVMVLFAKEVRNAPTISDKVPFLWVDYDPKKDPSSDLFEKELHHTDAFCKNCKFFDGTAICLHENNFGEININLINHCKKNAIFEAK
jgi:uridylate kinase